MLEIFTEKNLVWTVKGDVAVANRPVQDSVVCYLDEVIEKVEPLEYYIEHGMDSKVLSQFLLEDLPESSSEDQRKALIADVLYLTHLFFKLCKNKHIKVSIEPVKDDMCRLFHVDNIRQRMLCTYRGPGTQWLEESNIERTGLCKGDNSKIVKDFSLIQNAKPFEILLLKGKKLNTAAGGAVHRSPPISGSGEIRFLLKMDEC